jgi:hypothetical protein
MKIKIRAALSSAILIYILINPSLLLMSQTIVDSTFSDSAFTADTLKPFGDSLNIAGTNSIIDSLTAADSIKQKTPADTLYPIYSKALLSVNDYGETLNRSQINFLDYRYTGNLFSYITSGYLFDLGHIGQPNEASLYGIGNNNISYLADGISRTNRLLNSFDLNHFQSEYIDSLEVLPLTRGFLYSSCNNPVTVNFITTDKIANVPTTTIRFFQGPDNEGYIGAAFSAYIMNRLAGSIDVTTYGADERFINSESVNWNLSAKLHYLSSNKLNIIGSYNYVETTANLFGGVDVDSIRSVIEPESVDDEIFNALNAVVHYGFDGNQSLRYQKTTAHNIALKFLGNFNKLNSGLTFYYQFNKNEYRQNEYGRISGLAKIFDDNKYKVIGINFDNTLQYLFLRFKLISNYETIEYKSPLLIGKERRSSISIGGILSADFLDGLLSPSIFIKYLNYSEVNLIGFGSDININLSKKISLFAGGSYVEKPLNIIEQTAISSGNEMAAIYSSEFQPIHSKHKINLLETGLKFKTEFISGKVNYYQNVTQGLEPILFINDTGLKQNEAEVFRKKKYKTGGLSSSINILISKLLLSSNFNWNLNTDEEVYSIPEFTLMGGVYFVDTLFKGNLNLKTGFSTMLFGKRNSFIYDFEKSRRVYYQYIPGTNQFSLIDQNVLAADFQIDFFLAGTIQEAATVYFVWENLLGENYFQVAYYPQRARGIRLGVTWILFN